jgi:predicted NAD/FAD-binding protein
MKKIAVVGSGIAGMSAAYYLSRRHRVFLFEKDHRLGGHTHTVTVDSSAGRIPVDTGFIVHNDRTYPNLVALLRELGVETQPSDMSFAVSCRRTGFEYSSHGVRGFFAQISNTLRPGHYRLLMEILRFNREAPRLLSDPRGVNMTLADFLESGRYDAELAERYLLPMASAVWSASLDSIRAFPAYTLVQFFDNHGMLGINTHPKWKVLRGGSSSYIAPLTAPYRDRISLGRTIRTVGRSEFSATLVFDDGQQAAFDDVVFACHGDQVLPLLEKPTDREREVLSGFRTSRNEVCLHTDSSLLPKRAASRASWNYLLNLEGSPGATLTYHMNRLQSLNTPEDYCVTLNANAAIDPARVVRSLVYDHPLYTREAIHAQSRWQEISGLNRTHFCGAYWFYGFHEDGLRSGMRVARALGVDC